MAGRPQSGYDRGQGFNESDVEAEVSKAAADLDDLRATGLRPADPVVASEVIYDWTVTPLMASTLLAEVARLKVTNGDGPLLVHLAGFHVNWAYAATMEANHQVIARFAAGAAYQDRYQSLLTSVIAEAYPRRWCSLRLRTNGVLKQTLLQKYVASNAEDDGYYVLPVTLPDESATPDVESHKHFAFMGRKALEGIVAATNPYTAGNVAPTNVHDAYCGLPATLGWALDPIRPPIQAIRYAASTINKYKGHHAVRILTVKPPRTCIEYDGHLIREFDRQGALRVIAIEPGLTAAVAGLAWFLPGVEVCMFAPALGDQAAPVPKADAVVLNLANARSMALVEAAVKVAKYTYRTMTRDEVDSFWQHPATDPGTHATGLVAAAVQHLSDDGLLIVIGDVESGIHHQATKLLAKVPDLHAIKLTPKGRPVQFSYSKPPWSLAGGLAATDRFVSAWMKVTP